ncbi:hypothetical protein MKZ38_000633 [Zalerion maritima]|uniref:Uncharacterized protein n=1 Tax=Zalerion maritima TaxID=339359 RepID=A0AAD5RSC8_9PEZI|nr:hypothetical protein MKZ38_000633 [Zalerion maritima]
MGERGLVNGRDPLFERWDLKEGQKRSQVVVKKGPRWHVDTGFALRLLDARRAGRPNTAANNYGCHVQLDARRNRNQPVFFILILVGVHSAPEGLDSLTSAPFSSSLQEPDVVKVGISDSLPRMIGCPEVWLVLRIPEFSRLKAGILQSFRKLTVDGSTDEGWAKWEEGEDELDVSENHRSNDIQVARFLVPRKSLTAVHSNNNNNNNNNDNDNDNDNKPFLTPLIILYSQSRPRLANASILPPPSSLLLHHQVPKSRPQARMSCAEPQKGKSTQAARTQQAPAGTSGRNAPLPKQADSEPAQSGTAAGQSPGAGGGSRKTPRLLLGDEFMRQYISKGF